MFGYYKERARYSLVLACLTFPEKRPSQMSTCLPAVKISAKSTICQTTMRQFFLTSYVHCTAKVCPDCSNGTTVSSIGMIQPVKNMSEMSRWHHEISKKFRGKITWTSRLTTQVALCTMSRNHRNFERIFFLLSSIRIFNEISST